MRVGDLGRWRLLVVLGLVLGTALSADAQAPAEESFTNGFKSGRSYFSPEPWEHYDPVSGNVLLTFTDLVLPGNAGRSLSIQRTFNNQVSGDAAQVSRWTFGFPGIVMRVIEKSVPPNWVFEDSPFNITGTTPTFVMGDGSTRATMYVSRPTVATAAAAEVISTDFYKYDRQYHFIQMPDGTVCNYDSQTGRLTSCADRFGNTMQLAWTVSAVTVTQNLGQGQIREIEMGLDAEGRVTSLEYGTRHWSYEVRAPDGLYTRHHERHIAHRRNVDLHLRCAGSPLGDDLTRRPRGLRVRGLHPLCGSRGLVDHREPSQSAISDQWWTRCDSWSVANRLEHAGRMDVPDQHRDHHAIGCLRHLLQRNAAGSGSS